MLEKEKDLRANGALQKLLFNMIFMNHFFFYLKFLAIQDRWQNNDSKNMKTKEQ